MNRAASTVGSSTSLQISQTKKSYIHLPSALVSRGPRRSAGVLALVLAIVCGCGVARTLDTYPRRVGIDALNYRFELTLNDSTDEIVGRATVTVRFTADGIRALLLDLINLNEEGKGMRVSSVSSSTSELSFSHEGNVLKIALPEPGRVGSRFEVTIVYRGVPGDGLRIGPNRHGERTFFSDNWPIRARHWLPTIDHPGDKATNEFVITAPAHYQVVSNGLLIEETDRINGMRMTHWRNSVPIATWLYVLGVARFAVQQVDDFRGKAIQTWVAASDRDAGFIDFASPTRQVMDFYTDRVGPFAYEKLANVTSPATRGGMEAATAIMYGEDFITGEHTSRLRNVVIHEVAHQWFGNAVTEADWDHVWLSEGFATYFTLLFIEHAYGRDEFVAGLKSAANRIWSWYQENPDYRIIHSGLDDMSKVTSVATYQKGAWVLHMLRGHVGDEAFWRGIRSYYAEHFNGNATTDDLRRAMEEASSINLEGFFWRWLCEGGNPRLEGSWHYDPSAKTVTLDLSQVNSAGGPFDLPLEIGIFYAGEALPHLDRIHLKGGVERFTISVEKEPEDVVLDPNTWTLFQSDFRKR